MTAIMIQGTASDVGKSTFVAGLCRLARRRGIDVAPFKAQNMSNNAAVTADGGEIGRAQALQALAAGIPLSVDMNPVLLKPQSDRSAQVIVQGRVAATLEAAHYFSDRGALLEPVLQSYSRLARRHDLIIVEGAGSPAEVNLRTGDIANMGFARAADVPVCLLGDIDRGGVIAAIVGTRQVIDADDAAMITSFVINKFRGDPRLFDDGVVFIERATGWPCLGVVPWLPAASRLPAEDAATWLSSENAATTVAGSLTATVHEEGLPLRIVAPLLSRIANIDDADPLRLEPGVDFRFIPPGQALPRDADVVILFGTKSTRGDLEFMESQGWHHDIHAHRRAGGAVLGLCGGYQLLGETIDDPQGIDGPAGHCRGLGLLEVQTSMERQKVVSPCNGHCAISGTVTAGYEIHVGSTIGTDCARPMLYLEDRSEGARSVDGRVEGSYVHGLFASDEFRRAWLERHREGVAGPSLQNYRATVEAAIDAVADGLETSLDVERLLSLAREPR